MILMSPTTIAAAVAATAATVPSTGVAYVGGLHNVEYVVAKAVFLYGAGGTTANAYVQTSLDNGATWDDIMNFSFTTAAATKVSAVVSTTALAAGVTTTDGSLASNTILSGLLGSMLRVKYVTTGTYSGATSLAVYAVAKPFHR